MISKELKFLLTHSSIYGIGTVVSRLVAFLLLPLYTRYLTPADYGVLEMIDISSGIVGIVVTVGIARALSRYYYEFENQKEKNRVVSTTYMTFIVIACLFAPLLFFISEPLAKIIFSSGQYGYFFKISFISLILGGVVDIGMMYLRLIKKPFIFISITTTRLVLLILFNIIFIVYFKMGVLGILYSSLIVRSFYALLITSSILWKTKITFSRNISLDMLKYALPMIPSALGSGVVKQSDKYFVLYFLSIADMGIYSLALKLGNAVHSLITIPFNMAYIPRRFEIMKRDDASDVYNKIFTYYIFFLGYIGLALSVFVPEILKIMVTPQFIRAGELIPLVIFSMIIFSCHYHFDFGILYSKKTKYLAYVNLISAGVQLGLNFILIRRFGLFGAVWSSIIALGFQAFLLYFFSSKFYYIKYEFRRVSLYILTACIFYVISRQINIDNLFVDISFRIMLLIVFPLAVVLLRIITTEETAKLKEIYTNKLKPLIIKKALVKTN